jgi:uncharacterized protein YecE (DUF72 family)
VSPRPKASLKGDERGSVEKARPPARIYVGTASWAWPKGSEKVFSGGGSQLERYANVLGTVEINSCFYRPHRPATYARWAASTPDDFRFTLKLPRDISHADDFAAAAREHLGLDALTTHRVLGEGAIRQGVESG